MNILLTTPKTKTGTFLECDDPVHGSYYKNGAATQTLRLLGGSQYFPRCSYNAYLPPYEANFDFVVSQIQNTGWLDTRTWVFITLSLFYFSNFVTQSLVFAHSQQNHWKINESHSENPTLDRFRSFTTLQENTRKTTRKIQHSGAR